MTHIRHLKAVITAVFLLFLALILFFILRGKQDSGKELAVPDVRQEMAADQEQPDVVIKPFIRENIEGKSLKWAIKAEAGHIFSSYDDKGAITSQRIEIKNVETITIYPDNGPPVHISCKKALIMKQKTETRVIYLKGDVVVRSPGRGNLATKSLEYILKSDMIQTRDHVVFSHQGNRMTGKGLEYRVQQGVMKISSRFRARLYPGKGPNTEPIFVAGKTALIREKERKIILPTRSAFYFQEHWLKSNRTIIYLDEQNRLRDIELFYDVFGVLSYRTKQGKKDLYELFSRYIKVNMGRAWLYSIEVDNGFFIQQEDSGSFIAGKAAEFIFAENNEQRPEYILLKNGFYMENKNAGLYAANGTYYVEENRLLAHDAPILYAYPYVTTANKVDIRFNQNSLKAEKAVHTIIPATSSEKPDAPQDKLHMFAAERSDIFAEELRYDFASERITYSGACRVKSDSLTTASDTITIDNKNQQALFLGDVSGKVLQYNVKSDTYHATSYTSEYVEANADEGTVLLKTDKGIKPVIWEKDYRASADRVFLKDRGSHIFLNKAVQTTFFRDTYDQTDGSGFFSFDTADGPIDITADNLEINRTLNTIQYSSKVKATRESGTLTCDTMTIYYKDESTIEQVLCQGNLHIKDQEQAVMGDKGTYFPDKNEFHIFDNITYKDAKGVLENAQKLIYFIAENRYTVYGSDIRTTYDIGRKDKVERIFPEHTDKKNK